MQKLLLFKLGCAPSRPIALRLAKVEISREKAERKSANAERHLKASSIEQIGEIAILHIGI